MDIKITKAVTPVSSGLQSTADRNYSTATGQLSPAAVSPVAAPPAPARVPSAPQRDLQSRMEVVAAQLQEFLQSSERDIEFRVDADTGAQVVTVRDANSGDVIRQMPGEEVLRVLKNLTAGQGTLLDTKV
jgi:flagellar protein FlaG